MIPIEMLERSGLPSTQAIAKIKQQPAENKLFRSKVADLHEAWVFAIEQYAWSTRFPGTLFVSIPRWKALEKTWTHRAEHLIVTTEQMQAYYASLGCPEEKSVVLPNTIHTELFDNYPVNESILQAHRSEYTLVYTGGINLHRGLGFLLETMPLLLQHCAARLVIVGEGRIRSELEAQVKSLGIQEHVVFEGWRPQPEIKSYILASDVCLIPQVKCDHTDTTVPHKLFHYMYLKRPLVTTNCTYMQKVVASEDCGLVAPYGDHEAFAERLITLYKDPACRKQMGENGHRAVLDLYNWTHSVRSLIQMYRKMDQEVKTHK